MFQEVTGAPKGTAEKVEKFEGELTKLLPDPALRAVVLAIMLTRTMEQQGVCMAKGTVWVMEVMMTYPQFKGLRDCGAAHEELHEELLTHPIVARAIEKQKEETELPPLITDKNRLN